MRYKAVDEGIFLTRPNRFIAKVLINGKEETVHVKNTGRCKELLIEGCKVYLEKSSNPNRKTLYDLIAVEKIREDNKVLLVNMDSQAPNEVAYEWLLHSGLFPENTKLHREVTYKSSRFDLYAEGDKVKAFIEVKGVTLEKNGIALFPDAPTLRGIKHINELIDAKVNGYEAYVLFVIQMKEVHAFMPNCETHPEFARSLREAQRAGVKVLAVDCNVSKDSLTADKLVTVCLEKVF